MSQEFLDILNGMLSFKSAQLSFCTHFSWFGLVKNERLGLEELHLFYNRKARLLSPNFLTFRADGLDGARERQKKRQNHPLFIEETDGNGFIGRAAFLDNDILCYSFSLEPRSDAREIRATLLLPETNPRFARDIAYNSSTGRLRIETRVPRTDSRDTDTDHPLTICINVPPAFALSMIIADGLKTAPSQGTFTMRTDGALVMLFSAASENIGTSEQAFVTGIGEGPSADKIKGRMAHVRMASFETALKSSRKWLAEALDQLSLDSVPKRRRPKYEMSAYQILSNTKSPRGQIGRHSAFPSRGVYCAHYLWDACFANLGTARFNERLAEDFIVALCESQEPDGKVPQFVCATWNRPGESQPPLVAWSAWMLYERFGNKELIRSCYEPLCRMVEWWFAKRDRDGDGVVEYEHALESGWDDSPRFDKGRIAAVDLNAYLNREMRLLAKMAPVIAREHEALNWENRADEHARAVMNRLFDREDEMFYDRLVDKDRLHKVLTPASFTPLWAGLPVQHEAAHRMIIKYLINPRHFFGSKPFPCVAYSDPSYNPDKWWRGAVWPNIAWIMTEVLRMYGFERERKEAVRRLVEMMERGEAPNELYSSATGTPLGADGLCRTCAVLMALTADF